MSLKNLLPLQPACSSRPAGVVLAAVGVIIALSTGCTTVEPWQRRTLSDATMRGDRDPAGLLLAEQLKARSQPSGKTTFRNFDFSP